jgi:hypothetical protein
MVVNDILNPNGIESFNRKIKTIISKQDNNTLNNIINIYLNPRIGNKTMYLIEVLDLRPSDLRLICIELQNLFEHWVLTEYSSSIDDYYPRTLEPTVYQWLDGLSVIETVTILNEWSKNISVQSLLNQLNPNSKIYEVFLSLLNANIGQDKIVLSDKDPTVGPIVSKCTDLKPLYNRTCKHF